MDRRTRWFLAVLSLAGTLVSVAWANSPTSAASILAIHPYLPPAELQERFRPMAEFISRVLGREFVVRVGQDYGEHMEAIGRDRVDVAFMGPVQYVRMRQLYGPKPLLARLEVNHKTELHGVIFARRDSPLRLLTDLRGKRFAFADEYSTMGRVVPQWILDQAGVSVTAFASYQFMATHDDVALGVLSGDFDAGAVKQEVYDRFKGHGLRVLADLPTTPDQVFVTRATFPASDAERLRHALMGLKDEPGGAVILERLHPGLTGLVPAVDADYDSVRRMLLAIEGSPQP